MDETAHDLSFNIIESMLHQLIVSYRYVFNIYTFICQQINKLSEEDQKLCRHNNGHHGKGDSLIFEIVEIKEMNDVSIHDCMKMRWIDLYPQEHWG